MRGGASSFLLLCDDGYPYIVKFQNNPQHLRVLANEWLATRLAEFLGLTVPPCAIIQVDNSLLETCDQLKIQHSASHFENCATGRQFGSRLVGGLIGQQAMDYLPEKDLMQVSNGNEFAGFLAFDKWTCNADGRQAVFQQIQRQRQFQAWFIDQGYCFNGGEWKFVDAPLRGLYARNVVYRNICSWKDFEPWLTNIGEISADKIWDIALTIPPEWYAGDKVALETLVERLDLRRSQIRELIHDARRSSRDLFPSWSGC